MTNSKGMFVKAPPKTGQIPAPPLGAPPPAPAKAGLAVGTLEGPPPKAGDAAKAKAKASPSSMDVNQTASGIGNTLPPSTISVAAVDHLFDGNNHIAIEEANAKAQAGYAVGQPLEPAPGQQQQTAPPPPPPQRVPGPYGEQHYEEGDIFEGLEMSLPSVRRGFRWNQGEVMGQWVLTRCAEGEEDDYTDEEECDCEEEEEEEEEQQVQAKAKAKASPSSVDVNQTASGVGNNLTPSTISVVAVDNLFDGEGTGAFVSLPSFWQCLVHDEAKAKAGCGVGQVIHLPKSPPQQRDFEVSLSSSDDGNDSLQAQAKAKAKAIAKAGYAVGQHQHLSTSGLVVVLEPENFGPPVLPPVKAPPPKAVRVPGPLPHQVPPPGMYHGVKTGSPLKAPPLGVHAPVPPPQKEPPPGKYCGAKTGFNFPDSYHTDAPYTTPPAKNQTALGVGNTTTPPAELSLPPKSSPIPSDSPKSVPPPATLSLPPKSSPLPSDPSKSAPPSMDANQTAFGVGNTTMPPSPKRRRWGPSSTSQQAANVVQADGGLSAAQELMETAANVAAMDDTEDGGLFGPDDYIMMNSFSEADRHLPMTDDEGEDIIHDEEQEEEEDEEEEEEEEHEIDRSNDDDDDDDDDDGDAGAGMD